MKIASAFTSVLVALCLVVPIYSVANEVNHNNDSMLPQLEVQLENLSFHEIKQQMQDDLQEFKHFDPKRYLSVYISSYSSGEPKYQSSFDFPDAKEIQSNIDSYFKDKTFMQHIVGESSYVLLSKTYNSLSEEIYNNDRYKVPEPSLMLDSVRLKDGTTLSVLEPLVDEIAKLNTNKPIAAIDISILYTKPTSPITKLIFSKNSKQSQGDILIDSFGENSVTFSLAETVKDKLFYIEGIDSQGKALVNDSDSSYTFNPQQINHIRVFYEKVLNEIEKGKITDKPGLVAYVKQNYEPVSGKQSKGAKQTVIRYYFKGKINSVNIYLRPETELESKVISLSVSEDNYVKGVSIAQGDNKLYGLIDEQGQWVIEPYYGVLSHEIDDYYFARIDRYKDEGDLYLLNRKIKTFIKQPFFMMDPKFEKNHYIIVNRNRYNNFVKGLLDTETHHLVLPTNYKSIKVTPYFALGKLVEQDNQKSRLEIYNLKSNKKLLTNDIEIIADNENFFAADQVCSKQQTKEYDYTVGSGKSISYCYKGYKLYDINGKKVNSKIYRSLYGDFSQDNIHLVLDNNKKLQFINRKGQHLNITLDAYKDVSPYSNGLAIVQCRSNDLYGYIDIKGKLVIPCVYNDANYFLAGSALVKRDTGYSLINTENKVVKKLLGEWKEDFKPLTQDMPAPIYYFRNSSGVTKYNHEGKEIAK